MWKEEGVRGFFKGNFANILRAGPFSAFEFYFYELYKEQLFGSEVNRYLPKLVCGGMTGVTASTLTYPLDIVRTYQSIQLKIEVKNNLSIGSCF